MVMGIIVEDAIVAFFMLFIQSCLVKDGDEVMLMLLHVHHREEIVVSTRCELLVLRRVGGVGVIKSDWESIDVLGRGLRVLEDLLLVFIFFFDPCLLKRTVMSSASPFKDFLLLTLLAL